MGRDDARPVVDDGNPRPGSFEGDDGVAAIRSWVNLVSERSGNFQIHPQWGPLVDQIWVH
jgi:hypothetical protein